MADSIKLPPLPALRGFEAAARLQNFNLAAEELCLSPSAISHQVRQLEEFLGNPLFDRSPKGVILTSIGRKYLADVSPIFKELSKATSKAKSSKISEHVILKSSPGFAARWLMPRLKRLQDCVPNTELTLTTNDANTSKFDFEFRCAYTYPIENNDEVLLSSVRSPVCSPRYLEERGSIRDPLELTEHTLLREHHFDAWDQWFSIATPHQSIEANEIWFDEGYASMNAAELGLGVQLGYLEFLSAELADGRLVQLFNETAPKKTLFLLRKRNDWNKNPTLVSIRNWLLSEMNDVENVVDQIGIRSDFKKVGAVK